MKNLIPAGLKGKFAMINHWPEELNNEREIVSRIKIAASRWGWNALSWVRTVLRAARVKS